MRELFWLSDRELQTLFVALSERAPKRSARALLLARVRREIKARR